MEWMKILYVLGAFLLAFVLYRAVRGNSNAFSGQAMSKSFRTMRLLAVGLIIFVGLLVFLTRQ